MDFPRPLIKRALRNVEGSGRLKIAARTVGLVLLLTAMTSIRRANAQSPAAAAAHEPHICLGRLQHSVSEKRVRWGYADSRGCPAGHAVFGGQRGVMRPKNVPDSSVPFQADCCPVPAPDILTEMRSTTGLVCPPDHVVTGGVPFNQGCPSCPRPFTCTRINTARYRLAEAKPGVYWGVGVKYWQNPLRFQRRDIPAAIRYGMGRIGMFEFDNQGCIGYPFGSLLVGRTGTGTDCALLIFSELQYRGVPGDPPEGTPVKMFPDCADVTDFYSARAACVKEQ